MSDFNLAALMKVTADALEMQCRSYSGRGMFGKQCISVSGEDSEVKEFMESMILALKDWEVEGDCNFREELAKLMNYKQDSLGMGIVVYWPNIEPPIDDEEEFDEDEEFDAAADEQEFDETI